MQTCENAKSVLVNYVDRLPSESSLFKPAWESSSSWYTCGSENLNEFLSSRHIDFSCAAGYVSTIFPWTSAFDNCHSFCGSLACSCKRRGAWVRWWGCCWACTSLLEKAERLTALWSGLGRVGSVSTHEVSPWVHRHLVEKDGITREIKSNQSNGCLSMVVAVTDLLMSLLFSMGTWVPPAVLVCGAWSGNRTVDIIVLVVTLPVSDPRELRCEMTQKCEKCEIPAWKPCHLCCGLLSRTWCTPRPLCWCRTRVGCRYTGLCCASSCNSVKRFLTMSSCNLQFLWKLVNRLDNYLQIFGLPVMVRLGLSGKLRGNTESELNRVIAAVTWQVELQSNNQVGGLSTVECPCTMLMECSTSTQSPYL